MLVELKSHNLNVEWQGSRVILNLFHLTNTKNRTSQIQTTLSQAISHKISLDSRRLKRKNIFNSFFVVYLSLFLFSTKFFITLPYFTSWKIKIITHTHNPVRNAQILCNIFLSFVLTFLTSTWNILINRVVYMFLRCLRRLHRYKVK